MITVDNITKDDLEAWKAAPITAHVFKAIEDRLQEVRRDLGRGMYSDDKNSHRTQALSFKASGQCQALAEVLNINVEQ